MNSSPNTAAPDACIAQQILEEVVPRYRDKIASADEKVQLTFDDLGRGCLNLAHRLNAIAPEKPVGLLIPNGAFFPVATLACLAAGRPYVPIDPSYPSMHIESVIRDAGIGALITEKPDAVVAAEIPSLPTTDAASAVRSVDGGRLRISRAIGPAAILYTSGSTGRPKGACYDQQAIIERVQNATDTMQTSAQDRIAVLSSPVTIAALYLSFTALLNGATLYFADTRRLGINKVLQILREGGVTATFAVPALLRELLGAPGAKEAFSQFRALRTGGDVLVARDLGLWRGVLPSTCRIWISLASTEMPAVFQWIVPPDWEPDGARLPVGYARPEITSVIADESGAPVANGEVGELIVKSRHLCLGYWQNGSLQPFSTEPNDPSVRILHTGDLVRMRTDRLAEMVGRKDRQLKIRGFRINLAEVEGVIRNCEGVAAAAVVARRQREEVSALIAYVERKRSENVGATDLKDALAERLPRPMRPSEIHFVDAIPLLPGFKVDVRALLEIDQQHATRTATEAHVDCDSDNGHRPIWTETLHRTDADAHRVHTAVKQAWTTVLDHRSFDDNTPFDDAGGNSLDGLHLWSLIENALNAELSFDTLHLDMTPRALAEAIENQLTRNKRRLGQFSNKPKIFYMPTAEGDTFLQSQLRAGMSADVSFEIIRYPSTFDFLENEARFEALIEASVSQIVEQTDQPCNILGYSFGGFVAWATACRLMQVGRPLGFIGLIDARRNSDVRNQQPAAPWHQVLGQALIEPRYAAVRAVQRGVALIVDTGSITVQQKVYKAAALLSPSAAFRAQLFITERLRMYSGRQWKPAVLDHPVCLFRSDEYLSSRPDFGWGNVCPRLEIVHVGGTHDSLLQVPDRDVLCRRVVQKIKSSIEAPAAVQEKTSEQLTGLATIEQFEGGAIRSGQARQI